MISRKIWVTEKSWNFHTLNHHQLNSDYLFLNVFQKQTNRPIKWFFFKTRPPPHQSVDYSRFEYGHIFSSVACILIAVQRILEPLGHFLRSPTASQSQSSSAEKQQCNLSQVLQCWKDSHVEMSEHTKPNNEIKLRYQVRRSITIFCQFANCSILQNRKKIREYNVRHVDKIAVKQFHEIFFN